MQKKKNKRSNKFSLVVGVDPSSYEALDTRFMKPVCHQKYDNGKLVGSMLIQDLDSVNLTRYRKATYFVPNNIALLLSTSEKALKSARNIYDGSLSNSEIEIDIDRMNKNQKHKLGEVSSLICDYLENIQTAIVFGYTALEAFVNLSIPSDYQYKAEMNNTGVAKIYDKKAIERLLPLREKIKHILTIIYETSTIDNKKWWGNFTNLENYRNDIIHQKSIEHTEFYKTYFKPGIFKVCNSPVEVMQFFHDSHLEQNRTNPMWPWIGDNSSVPINMSFDKTKFEVIGNIHEGIKK